MTDFCLQGVVEHVCPAVPLGGREHRGHERQGQGAREGGEAAGGVGQLGQGPPKQGQLRFTRTQAF
jgi:hypothetical protein